MFRLLYFVPFIAMLASCGIPQISPPPFSVELRKINDDIYLDFGESDTINTRGVVILYGIFKLSNESDYENTRNKIEQQSSTTGAYNTAVNLGFSPVHISEVPGTPIPTIEVNDYPGLFDGDVMAGGKNIDSFNSSAGSGVYLKYDNSAQELVLHVKEPSAPDKPSNLRRSNNEGFFSVALEDDDVKSISGSDLYLAIAVFGFNSTFKEGTKYSEPDVSPKTDLVRLNQNLGS